MFRTYLSSFLVLAAGLQSVLAQSSSTACNNSPELCSRQYNNVTYLGARNSPFLRDDTTDFSTSGNQVCIRSATSRLGMADTTSSTTPPDSLLRVSVC